MVAVHQLFQFFLCCQPFRIGSGGGGRSTATAAAGTTIATAAGTAAAGTAARTAGGTRHFHTFPFPGR